MTKNSVTKTFSEKLNVTNPCSSPNDSGDEIKSLSDKSRSSPKIIFLVVTMLLTTLVGLSDS